MDGTLIGTIIGTAILTLSGAGYAGSRLNKKVNEVQEQTGEIDKHGVDLNKQDRRIQELESQTKQQDKQIEDLKRQLDQALSRIDSRNNSIDTRLGTCVTDEEFQAYTASTTQAITGLTEKVGRATGVLETWTRTRS
jgi:peptidoglycan hydrolase CwlO-like protein